MIDTPPVSKFMITSLCKKLEWVFDYDYIYDDGPSKESIYVGRNLSLERKLEIGNCRGVSTTLSCSWGIVCHVYE